MWAMIATWRMALEGVEEASEQLKQNKDCNTCIVEAIQQVENNEYYKSVGFGGLPNCEGEVEMDAAFMNGDTLDIGAVAAIKDFKNPIAIAYQLSKQNVNCFLAGEGAQAYASKQGFERKNMLSERAKIHYENRCKEDQQELTPYIGHDTVGMVCLDQAGSMSVATSTSGLFMKNKGRVGDSPISGSGFYVDSEVGGASATGLGEDLMKGCISYEIVRLMREGYHPQLACETAVNTLAATLKKKRNKVGDLSVVALNNKGEFGCATNIENFSFVVATSNQPPVVYLVKKSPTNETRFEEASKQWLKEYMESRMAPLERK